MRLISGVIVCLATASLVAAQAMPTCAADCLVKYLPESPCNATDVGCICTNGPLMANVQACTLASCTIKESLTTLNATQTMCGAPVRDITIITPLVTGISGGLAVVAVILRLVDGATRSWTFTWADGCVTLSLLCAVAMGILEFIMSADGFGKDVWTIPFPNINRIVQYTWLTEMLYMASLGLTKIAIFLFYLMIFPFNPFKTICYISIAFCIAYIPAFVFPVAFNCTPVEYIWEGWAGETVGHCVNFNAFAWSHAIINIVLDLFILVVPVPMIMRLNMGRRKKYQLAVMFLLGIFITIVSIIRLKSLVEFATTTNATYDNVPTAYWSVLEAYVSIICCCLPAFRSLLRRTLPNVFGGSSIKKSSGGLSNSYGSKISSRFGVHKGSSRLPLSANDDDDEEEMMSSVARRGGVGGIQKTMTASVSLVESDGLEMADRNEEGRQRRWQEAGW